jgi:hypothetical protein
MNVQTNAVKAPLIDCLSILQIIDFHNEIMKKPYIFFCLPGIFTFKMQEHYSCHELLLLNVNTKLGDFLNFPFSCKILKH